MSDEHQIEILPTGILIGISSGPGILDLIAKKQEIEAGIRLLRAERTSLMWETVGCFGTYPVTLNVSPLDGISLFVDGPDVRTGRNMSAAIYVEEKRLLAILSEALKMANQQISQPTSDGVADR